MQPYIDSVRENVRMIVQRLVQTEQIRDIQLGLVAYRDHPPMDNTFVTMTYGFNPDPDRMHKILANLKASGGGDCPEAVADAMKNAYTLSWRHDSTKICVLITDGPPHGLVKFGDTFPNGCPDGLDPMELARELAQKDITLYVIGCEPSVAAYKSFYVALAHVTGGQYVPLVEAQLLSGVIVGGTQEELSLRRWVNDVKKDVMEEVKINKYDINMDKVTERVYTKLRSKGARAKQLWMNNESLQAPSKQEKDLAMCPTMAAVRGKFKLAEPTCVAGDPGTVATKGKRKRKRRDSGLLRALPPVIANMASASPAMNVCFSAVSADVDMQQAERMVQKCLWQCYAEPTS